MVPEWFRNPILVNFGKGSGAVPEAFHVSPEDEFGDDPSASALGARIGVVLSVVLSSYSGWPFGCLKECVGCLHDTFLGLPENIRRFPGYICRTVLISAVVITIWLRIMTQIVFRAAGVGRHGVKLLYTRIHIGLCVTIYVSSVVRFVWLRNNFWGISWYDSRSVPQFVSCLFRSYCNLGWIGCCQIIVITVKYWLVIFTFPRPGI